MTRGKESKTERKKKKNPHNKGKFVPKSLHLFISKEKELKTTAKIGAVLLFYRLQEDSETYKAGGAPRCSAGAWWNSNTRENKIQFKFLP